MSLEIAVRLVEIGVSLALLQRSAEHVPDARRALFLGQMLLALVLLVGLYRGPVVCGLWILGVLQLYRFDGPYNGGADKMAMLVLTCLGIAHLAPGWADVAMAYLAVQLVLSYFISGGVKLLNPDWRNGRALADVFAHSIYPVGGNTRAMARWPRVMFAASWAVILFEIAFPIALLHPTALAFGLGLAAAFHLANAGLFGLNRFFWVWISAFPALVWFQGRLIGI